MQFNYLSVVYLSWVKKIYLLLLFIVINGTKIFPLVYLKVYRKKNIKKRKEKEKKN